MKQKNRLQSLSTLIVTAFAATTLLLFFQNCSPTPGDGASITPGDGASISPPQNLSFFQYNYAAKPNLYANLALVFPKEQTGSFANFKFYGMVTPADGSYGYISYSVRITDDTHQTICAGETGVLDPDNQNIVFECLASPTITAANVTLVATYNGLQETFTSTFSK